MNDFLTVIGAGLAGSEAAWQAAERGVQVVLYEMRPVVHNPVHKTENFAELVASLSREHRLLQKLAAKEGTGSKSLLSGLPPELQKPIASVEEAAPQELL